MEKEFCTENDIIKIATTLTNEFSDYDLSDVEIRIGLPSFKLRKLDEYLFRKFNPKLPLTEFTSQEEVKLNIGLIKFTLFKNSDKEPELKKDEYGNEYF